VIIYTDAAGVQRQISRILPDTLAPTEARRLATGLGPFAAGQNYAVTLTSARVIPQ
jgi:hypothetical protein